jgi:putative PEP-CTERM system TPR-repeat lipoprotein
MSGSVDVAIDELKNISVLDNGSSADLALYNFYINKKDFDKALDVVGILDKKMPGKPLPPHLQGRTLLAKNDLSGAAKSFERAAAIDPSFFPAISSLAALDRLAGRPELAKSRYESFLSKSPKNVQAWLELVDMALKTGSSKDDISKLIAKAIASNPEDVKTRLFQIEFYLKAKDIKAAGIAAQNSVSALPGSAELLDALGRTQIAAGDFNQALLTYQKLASQDVNSYLPHIRLADVYAATKNKDAAIQSLQRALELKSDFRPAQRSLIFIDVKDKNYSRALSMAKIIQQQSPKDEEGFALEADIFASQNKWPEALAALQSGMKQVNSPVLSFKQYYFLYGTGKVTEAEKLSEKWQKENPKDSIFLFYLGDAYLTRNDFKGAEKIYLSLLNLKSENAVVYNNLAWVLDKLKKPGAIHYAEKANKLLPNNPAFMDTLAQIYNNSDSFEKAVDWQLKALLLDPSNTVFKLNLAKIYVKSGKNDLARKQLEELRALGNNFPSYAEVLNLLKTV